MPAFVQCITHNGFVNTVGSVRQLFLVLVLNYGRGDYIFKKKKCAGHMSQSSQISAAAMIDGMYVRDGFSAKLLIYKTGFLPVILYGLAALTTVRGYNLDRTKSLTLSNW